MIIKGGTRAGGADLGVHLSRTDTNEQVRLLELRGVAGMNLDQALREMEAFGAGTRCKSPLYHANIDPRADERLTPEQWGRAVDALEAKLGFTGQPRALVQHVKEGREHVHVVWSRIDLERNRAIPDSHNFRKHEEVARALEREFGHERVQGAHVERDGKERPARTPSHAEMQQAARSGLDPKAIKAEITALWRQTDSGKAFAGALAEAGYILARGDRRDFIVIDQAGESHSLARRIEGEKAAGIRARLSDIDQATLPDARDARAEQAQKALEAAQKAEEARRAAEAAQKAEEARRAAEAVQKAEEARRAAEAAQKAAEAAQEAVERQQAADEGLRARWRSLPLPALQIEIESMRAEKNRGEEAIREVGVANVLLRGAELRIEEAKSRIEQAIAVQKDLWDEWGRGPVGWLKQVAVKTGVLVPAAWQQAERQKIDALGKLATGGADKHQAELDLARWKPLADAYTAEPVEGRPKVEDRLEKAMAALNHKLVAQREAERLEQARQRQQRADERRREWEARYEREQREAVEQQRQAEIAEIPKIVRNLEAITPTEGRTARIRFAANLPPDECQRQQDLLRRYPDEAKSAVKAEMFEREAQANREKDRGFDMMD
jgi:Relaxase/Mobilisation nuclease domain.